MLYYVNARIMSIEEFSQKLNKSICECPDLVFDIISRDYDLNRDEFFAMALLKVGNADIPMDNVARDLITGRTYSFDKISTGIRSLWLMNYFGTKYIYQSCYFGENCYKVLAELAQYTDVYLYDNSSMLVSEEFDDSVGNFTDYTTGEEIPWSNAYSYFCDRGLYEKLF